MLDEALLRPGRLEVQVEIGLPDEAGRVQILQVRACTYMCVCVRCEQQSDDDKLCPPDGNTSPLPCILPSPPLTPCTDPHQQDDHQLVPRRRRRPR